LIPFGEQHYGSIQVEEMKTENSQSIDSESPSRTSSSNEHKIIESPMRVSIGNKNSNKLELGNADDQNSMINISYQYQHNNLTDDSFG